MTQTMEIDGEIMETAYEKDRHVFKAIQTSKDIINEYFEGSMRHPEQLRVMAVSPYPETRPDRWDDVEVVGLIYLDKPHRSFEDAIYMLGDLTITIHKVLDGKGIPSSKRPMWIFAGMMDLPRDLDRYE